MKKKTTLKILNPKPTPIFSNRWVGFSHSPIEKYAQVKIGSFPQVGVKIKIFETTTMMI